MKIISYIVKLPIALNIAMIISFVSIIVIDFYLKSMKDKENVNKFISFKVSNILGTYNTQINEIKKLSNNIDE